MSNFVFYKEDSLNNKIKLNKGSTISANETLIVEITPQNTSHQYRFRCSVNGVDVFTSGWIQNNSNQSLITHNLSTEADNANKGLYTWLPSSWSGVVTIYCYTYPQGTSDGSKYLSRTSQEFTLKIPSNTSPKINNITVSIDNQSYYDEYSAQIPDLLSNSDLAIKNISNIIFTIDASPGDGSTISRYYCDNIVNLFGDDNIFTIYGSSYSVFGFTYRPTYTFSVVDSRGKVASKPYNLQIYDYARPQIKSFVCHRCQSDGTLDPTGTHFKSIVQVKYNPIDQNLVFGEVLCNELNLQENLTFTCIDEDNSIYEGTYMSSNGQINSSTTYNFSCRISDTISYPLGSEFFSTENYTLSPAKSVINFSKHNNGIAIGGFSSRNSNVNSDALLESFWGLKVIGRAITLSSSNDQHRCQLYIQSNGNPIITAEDYEETKDASGKGTGQYAWITKNSIKLSDGMLESEHGSGVLVSGSDNKHQGVFYIGNNGYPTVVANRWDYIDNEGMSYEDDFGNNEYQWMQSGYMRILNNTNSVNKTNDCSLQLSHGLYTNGKSKPYEKQGIHVSANGRVYAVGGTGTNAGPGIMFAFNKNATTATSYIAETSSGNLTLKGTLTGSLNNTSDKRTKKDFKGLESFENFYNDLNPCCFRMKTEDEKYHIGFIAQEVEESLKNNGLTNDDFAALSITPYEGDKDESSIDNIGIYENTGINQGEDIYGLVYSEFIALNTHMIQKLQKEIEALKAEIKELKDNN